MHRRNFLISATTMSALSTSACATQVSPSREISNIFALRAGASEAPFGGEISPDIVNYTRVAPRAATAGFLRGAGLEEAQKLGFALIIDLRRPSENGVAKEQATAGRIGLNYLNLPLLADESAWDQVSAVTSALEDDRNLPVLIHCASANRAGALWALYRARQGVAPIVAIEEGRAAGLKSREASVRDLLGLPAI